MSRLLSSLLVVVCWAGCTPDPAPIPDIEDYEDPGAHRFTLHPPVVGQGTHVKLELESRRSALEFDETTLELFSEGLVLTDFAVLDGFTAIAELTIADDAPLGPVDARLTAANLEWELPEALLVIEESFGIEPGNAKMGEVIDVVLLGHETAWEPEITWASFGRDVDTIAVEVVSPTELHARVAVHSDAQPGFRDITVEQGAGVLTLYDGFTVDRAVITATFDPPVVSQGDEVAFVIQGVNTRFAEGFLQEQMQFWNRNTVTGDFRVETFERTSPTELRGTMRVSNAAVPGFRDVFLDDEEDLLIADAVQILPVEPDPLDVAVGLAFDVRRGLDASTGVEHDTVNAFVYFVIPLNFGCGPAGLPSSGPVPFDINGVFEVPPPQPSIDCPEPLTVSAGDFVFFESEENVVTLHKEVIASTGQIIYRGRDLTLDDYHFGLDYDLRAPGDPDGVPAFVVEDAQPTVPENYHITAPTFAGLTVSRFEDFAFDWTSAGVYPQGLFTVSLNGTLESTGEGGYVGVIPFDDGHHVFGPGSLSQLQAGPATFVAVSGVEGRVWTLPFNGRQHQSDSTLVTTGFLELE
ncbi:MAG: hypothetical protein H6737_19275 [Alphaproteobacteria bacterium]|nr:hypothetical protein [Alphaproteobacteria bacterium]